MKYKIDWRGVLKTVRFYASASPKPSGWYVRKVECDVNGVEYDGGIYREVPTKKEAKRIAAIENEALELRLAAEKMTEEAEAPRLTEQDKEILYAAWSLRNQFNGVWDIEYFPALAKALDAKFGDCNFPLHLLPKRYGKNK